MKSKIFKICLLGILMMCGFAVQVSAIEIRGFGNWPDSGNSSNVKEILLNETNHLRFTVSNATVRANNSFKIYDNGWYAAASGNNTFNLSGNNISHSETFSSNGADMTITTPSDGTFDYMIDVVKDNGEYTVTITRIPQVRGFGDSSWSSDQANLQYNSNGHWTGSITKSQMQPANTINFKLFDGLWRGLPEASNRLFDIRQVNNNYTSKKTDIIDEGKNLYIWAPTWDTGDKKYYFDIFWESTGYNVTIKRIPNKVYIGGSIAADPETTQVTNNNQTWDQHNSDTYPNLVLTDSGDGEYYIDFTPEALANSNRNAILNNGTGMDFRFVEVEQEEGGAVYNVYPSSSPKELSSNYNDTPLNHEGSPGDNYISVTPENGTVLYRIWFKNDNGSRSAKVEKGQAEFYIYGSMSDDPETTSGATWGGGMNANRKLTDSGNGEYFIDFSATAFANSKRGAPYIGLDFRFIESISVSKFNNYPHLFPQPGEGNTATALPLTSSYQNIISGSNSDHHDSYMGVAEVDGATNYRVYLKRTESGGSTTYQAKVDVTAPYAELIVTGGSTIRGTATANGYTFTIPQTGNYSLNSTITFQVAIFDGTDLQYIPATTIGTKDTDYSYTLANTAGNVTYGVPADADDEIIVTVNTSTNKISLTHGSIGHAGTTEQYYVVGTWFGSTYDNAVYNERRFQMKKNPDGTYYFDIPANMQLHCQILSSTGTLYYPNIGDDFIMDCKYPNNAGSNNNVSSAERPASGTTGVKWYFRGVQADGRTPDDGVESITAGGQTYMDGTFRLTFDPANAKWSVSYSTTRVSYLSAIANDWKVDFLYDESRDHRHFGSAYIDTGGFKILNAWSYHNQDPSLYPNTKLIEKGNNGQNGLLGGANLDLTPMTGTSQNGHIIPMSAKGLYLVEDDPTRGNQVYTGENAWDNLLLFNSSGGTDPNPVFQTISLVGPAFPETMTGTDWDPAKGIDLYYDAEEQCFKTTVTTSQAAGQLFRFVADHTITTNWGEESTADEDKARVPYDGSGTGHAATDADPNTVKITKDATASNRNGSGNYGDIIFNRPAGNWVIRFYLRTPDTKVTSFYYTITESTEPDVILTPQSGIYESAVLTPTTVENATHYTMTVNVQVVNAPKYKYTIGQDVSLDDAGVPVVTYNASNSFGSFRYNGDAEAPKVWFTPNGGSETELSTSSSPATLVLNGARATVYVNVVAADAGNNSRSAERTYTYTFMPSADLEPITGGTFINKTTVHISGGKGTLYYTTGDKAMNETNRIAVPANRQVVVSTPGTMTVTDGFTTQTANFDFTYSTSENYTNFWHNTPGEIVYTNGGKNATSVFIEVEDNMPLRIYAWNYSKDQMLIKKQDEEHPVEEGQTKYSQTAVGFNERDPQVKLTSYYPGTVLDDSRLLTIGGQKFFYLVVPKEKLKYTNEDKEEVYGEMAIILSRSTRASSTLDADHYKTPNTIVDANSTFEYFSSPNTMSGNNVSTYNSYLAMPVNDDLTKIYGDNVVFIEVPSTWTSAYCYAWNSTDNNGWPGVRMSHVKTLEGGNQVFACQLIRRLATSDTKLIFTENGQTEASDPKRWKSDDMVFKSRGYYTQAGAATSNISTDSGVSATITDWIARDYSEMEDYTVFPNGEEYHEMRPDDKTYMLDPTWGGVIASPTTLTNEEWSITHWSGYPESSETSEGGYRKRITSSMNLTQTVLHLDTDKEYTVQALVRATGENGTKVKLTLNGKSEVSDEKLARHAGGGGNVGSGVEGSFVNKNGRVEYLTPGVFTSMNKQEGIGWIKLQAKVQPDQSTGNLQITISRTAGDNWFDLADVVLLEDADRADGTTYRTTATKITSPVTYGQGTLEMGTSADYRDWVSTASTQKNNAFSFFDRGENRNAVVFANEHTVLCLDGHEHPYNVVKTTSANDQAGVCPVLYLTDMGVGDILQTSTTDADKYKGSGYTFKPVIPFQASNVVYDRSYNNTKSTMILPFALTQAQIKAAYRDNVKVYTFSHYDADTKRVEFAALAENDVLAANKPFILFDANGTLDSRTGDQLTARGESKMSIPAINTNTIVAPIAESAQGGFTGRYDYARMSTHNTGNTECYYGYSNNQFLIVNSAGANMKPFRAFFTVPVPYNGSASAPALSISFVEPQVTGITTVEDRSLKDGYIYSVNGMLVRRDSRTDSLPKGIYILNGRKFVVK